MPGRRQNLILHISSTIAGRAAGVPNTTPTEMNTGLATASQARRTLDEKSAYAGGNWKTWISSYKVITGENIQWGLTYSNY